MIVNVGPVHLELLGTVDRVAAAKAELIRDLRPGAACVVPAGEPLLEAHLRDDLDTITFGPGGEVMLLALRRGQGGDRGARASGSSSSCPTTSPTTCSTRSPRWAPRWRSGSSRRAGVEPRFSSHARRGAWSCPAGVTVVNDCYNANPMSMRAALQHLAETPAERRVAMLGTMAELGPGSDAFHRDIGHEAAALGIDVLVTVGEEAAGYGEGFEGETYAAGHARGGRRAARGDRPAGRPRAGQGLALGRASRGSSPRWGRS